MILKTQIKTAVVFALILGCSKKPADVVVPEVQTQPPAVVRYDAFEADSDLYPHTEPKQTCSRTTIKRTECLKEWTTLIFMAADNDLTPYALEDLYEMESGFQSGQYAGSTYKLDVLVEMDLAGNEGSERFHIHQQNQAYDTELILSGVFHDQKKGRALIKSPVLKRFPEEGLSTEKRLENFLKWGIQNYPSKRYIVVFWGHGEGWGTGNKKSTYSAHVGRSGRQGGILFDDTPRSEVLGTPQMREVLEEVRKFSLKGKKFDLIANDACMMQTLEVLTELKDEAHYILGSSQIQNFHGLPYRRIFYSLNASHWAGVSLKERNKRCSDDRACWLAYIMPKLVKGAWDHRGLQGKLDPLAKEDFTYSAFATSGLEKSLLEPLEEIGSALDNIVKSAPSLVYNALFEVPRYDIGTAELGHFISKIEEHLVYQSKSPLSQKLKAAAMRLQTGLVYQNISYYYGRQYLLNSKYPLGSGTRVLSIWLPRTEHEYEALIHDYSQNSKMFVDIPSWNSWMHSLFKP